MITKEHNSIYTCVCVHLYLYIYINISGPSFEMVLESFSTRRHTFYEIVYALKVYFRPLLRLFSKILQSFKGNAQSQATLSCKEYHLL